MATDGRTTSSFAQLGLIEPLLRAVDALGHHTPTPIQMRAIPAVLEGRDLLACAQTGTGKTGAFALPLLQRLSEGAPQRAPRLLVLAPTRELAAQINEDFRDYARFTKLRGVVVYGGVGIHGQIERLREGCDVLVACPGRLCDLADQRAVDFRSIETLVLDEADRMLDQGFWPAIERILRLLPRERQTLFFSATMPAELRPLAERVLRDPARMETAPVASTPDRIDQAVYFVDQRDKRGLLEHVLGDREITRALVFTRTKHGADRVAKALVRLQVSAEAIHGNKSQNARERALSRFREGSVRVLVATDVAARGIDIDGVTHVVNYDLPNDPEGYVHRIGRTARAGARGRAISFCSQDEKATLQRIERLIRRRVRIIGDHPYRAA